VLPCEFVREFLDELLEDKIIKMGKNLGSYVPKHSLFLNGKTPTIDNVLEKMKTKSQNSKWYQFNSQTTNGKLKLLLRHKLGKNWSTYLNSYYQTLFKQLLKTTIKLEIGEDSIVITISKNSTEENF